METTKRILTLTGTTYPKAEVQSVDPINGVLLFAWCNADGERIDSGNSIARFEIVYIAGGAPDSVGEYEQPSDETLAAAIQAVV